MNDDNELLKLLSAFQHHQVKYLIIGGLAVNRYGFNRHTADIDIYLENSAANRKSLVESLDDAGYGYFEPLLHTPILAGYCEILMDNGIYIDLMTDVPGLNNSEFDSYLSKASYDSIAGIQIAYISLTDLLRNKEATGRNKDLIDIEELKKIHS